MSPRSKVICAIVLLSGALWLGSLGQASSVNGQSQVATPGLLDVAVARGEISQEQADLYLAYALTDYEKLPSEYRSTTPWDGTLPLLHLQERTKTMRPSVIRAQIVEAISAICSTSSGSLPSNTSTTHFYVEYGTISGGLNINVYTTSLEASWTQQITTFGWAAPPVKTSNPPPGNRYHMRIDSLGSSLYGYVSSGGDYAGLIGNNPNTAWDDVDAYATCMVLNNDYSGFPGTPQKALDATTAHEFNHSIQFGFGGLSGSNTPDDAFVEGGATWMEDEVFDAANDNYNYLWPTFTMCMGEYTNSPYDYWITWRGLTERYGTGSAGAGEQVVQDFWEETSKGTGNNLSAMNTALVNKGTNLADAYHAYAIAAKFNKTCGGSYVYPYCFEEAAGYLATGGATTVQGSIATVGGSYSGSVADNYALNWISLPTSGSPYTVTLQNTSAGGQLRASVVCDTGSALSATPLPAVVGAGASSSLGSFNPSGCSSVEAVITNQSQSANNPSSCTSRSYQLRAELGGTVQKFVYLPLIRKDAPPVTTWAVLVNETFEGSFPGVWDVSDNDGTANGEYFWAKRSCRANGGTYSGWGVGGGANGAALGCGSSYPNNADSWMVFGPFSLADAAAAELNFDLWLNTEFGIDEVCRLASTDGTNFDGTCTYGDSVGWITRTLNLSSYLGQSNVWIALNFYSDASDVLAEGGYVDNIVLRKCTSTGCPTAAVSAFEVNSVVESLQEKTRIRRRP